MRRAQEWRRDRDIDLIASGLQFVLAAAGARVSPRTIVQAFPGYGQGDKEA